jgi:hypothetical protein
MLQRSVTLIRKFVCCLPKESSNIPNYLAAPVSG